MFASRTKKFHFGFFASSSIRTDRLMACLNICVCTSCGSASICRTRASNMPATTVRLLAALSGSAWRRAACPDEPASAWRLDSLFLWQRIGRIVRENVQWIASRDREARSYRGEASRSPKFRISSSLDHKPIKFMQATLRNKVACSMLPTAGGTRGQCRQRAKL